MEVASSLTLPFVDPVYTNLGTDVSIQVGSTGHKLFRATWTPNTETSHIAEYYTRNLDGTYSLKETNNLVGTTDENVQIMIKDFVGFTAEPTHMDVVSSGNVNADGSLVLKMYYTRSVYNVTFLNDDDSVIKKEAFEFGDAIVKPENPIKSGHTFAAWTPVVDTTVPANDVTYKATYVVNKVEVSLEETGFTINLRILSSLLLMLIMFFLVRVLLKRRTN